MGRKHKDKLKRIITILAVTILASVAVLILGISGAYYFVQYQLVTPLSDQFSEQTFVINEGEGLGEISAKLEEASLIRGKLWFTGYIFYKGWSTQLQAGEYFLSPSLSIVQMARGIVSGDVVLHEVKVTIPEGFTLRQIDARLSKIGLINEGELLEYPALEGYLFPDTYRFNTRDNLEDIIQKMRDTFDQKLDTGLRDEITRQGKTIEEIITMASILEKEVAYYSEQRIVSGIFWKRLKDHYPLQSCATIAYALGVDKWRYSIADTKVDSPYNTYQNVGLPPGPINNPGLLAIKAAIYSEATDYYFFLSAKDGTTIFSRTTEEHYANKAKYLD